MMKISLHVYLWINYVALKLHDIKILLYYEIHIKEFFYHLNN